MSTPIVHQFIIPKEYEGKRLDQTLAALLPQYSRTRIKSWIEKGDLLVDSVIKRPRDKVQGNEEILLKTTLEDETDVQPEAIPLSIVYEDNDLLIINKPVGLVVHPGAGIQNNTLLNALFYHNPSAAQLPRGGIIHRLDKNTSGLLIVAKNLPAYTFLVQALQKREIHRGYEAICIGTLTGGGTIDAPIGRHITHRTRMAVIEQGKPAITHYRILEKFLHFTHLSVQLETGRTHQIRVHMAFIHHPLIGDSTYGGRLQLPPHPSEQLTLCLRQFKHQALHASRLSLIHPTSKKQLTFTAPIPDDMNELLTILRKEDKRFNNHAE